jgi:hypothetical protein
MTGIGAALRCVRGTSGQPRMHPRTGRWNLLINLETTIEVLTTPK